jgi:hypothetical protein
LYDWNREEEKTLLNMGSQDINKEALPQSPVNVRRSVRKSEDTLHQYRDATWRALQSKVRSEGPKRCSRTVQKTGRNSDHSLRHIDASMSFVAPAVGNGKACSECIPCFQLFPTSASVICHTTRHRMLTNSQSYSSNSTVPLCPRHLQTQS